MSRVVKIRIVIELMGNVVLLFEALIESSMPAAAEGSPSGRSRFLHRKFKSDIVGRIN
jgi:hypothetical protein